MESAQLRTSQQPSIARVESLLKRPVRGRQSPDPPLLFPKTSPKSLRRRLRLGPSQTAAGRGGGRGGRGAVPLSSPSGGLVGSGDEGLPPNARWGTTANAKSSWERCNWQPGPKGLENRNRRSELIVLPSAEDTIDSASVYCYFTIIDFCARQRLQTAVQILS